MSETLSAVEPGFYSQIKEDPSLFVAPTSIEVVGFIGEGVATKTTTDTLTRGATASVIVHGLSSDISSINSVYTANIFSVQPSVYGFAVKGSVAPGSTAAGTSLSLVVGSGATQTVGFTGAGSTTIDSIISQINAGITGVKAISDAGVLVVAALDGQLISGVMGSATPVLKFTNGQVSNSIWFDPSVTDEDLAPQAGTEFFVEYETPKVAADYAVKYFTGSPAVYAEYGDPTVANSISLGVHAAFGAPGATFVACRQVNPANIGTTGAARAEITAVLKDFEKANVKIIVSMIPINDNVTAIPLYLTHVSKMSSKLERKERIVILATDETSAAIPILGATGSWTEIASYFTVSASSGLTPKRVIVVAPGIATASVKSASIEVDGTYVAAGLAGRIVSTEFDTATPMTRKTIFTIESLDVPERSRPEKNALTALGVTVVEMKNGLATVRRAITADATSMASQEPSIVRSMDQVVAELRESLENRYTGQKIGKGTKTSLEAATAGFLDRYVNDEIIGGFRSILATRNVNEPRQFDISAEIIPVWPFLWGSIDLSIVIE